MVRFYNWVNSQSVKSNKKEASKLQCRIVDIKYDSVSVHQMKKSREYWVYPFS